MVSTAASHQEGPRFDSRIGDFSVQSLHLLSVPSCVHSGCYGFLSLAKNVLVKLTVDCELLKVVNAGVCPHISAPENWRFVQGVLHLHIMIAGMGSSLCDV